MSLRLAVDVIGWVGAGALLLAYALVSMRRVDGQAPSYQLMNFVGGLCLVVNTAYYGAFPSTLLNAVWAAVAVLTLAHARLFLKDRWPTDPDA